MQCRIHAGLGGQRIDRHVAGRILDGGSLSECGCRGCHVSSCLPRTSKLKPFAGEQPRLRREIAQQPFGNGNAPARITRFMAQHQARFALVACGYHADQYGIHPGFEPCTGTHPIGSDSFIIGAAATHHNAPVEDDGRLTQPIEQESFLPRLFAGDGEPRITHG